MGSCTVVSLMSSRSDDRVYVAQRSTHRASCVHSLDRVPLVHEVGYLDDGGVPRVEVVLGGSSWHSCLFISGPWSTYHPSKCRGFNSPNPGSGRRWPHTVLSVSSVLTESPWTSIPGPSPSSPSRRFATAASFQPFACVSGHVRSLLPVIPDRLERDDPGLGGDLPDVRSVAQEKVVCWPSADLLGARRRLEVEDGGGDDPYVRSCL